jgi:uncharacterized membrane protein
MRLAATGTLTYTFLVWNLFLGFIPYAVSEWLYKHIHRFGKITIITLLLVWLLFIPNSFYIVTDLFHLDQFDNAPKWFDLLLLFSFAWNGLLLGLLSLRKAEVIIGMMFGRRLLSLTIFVVMWLNAFGIYIGRFLRYNSWDVIADPFSLFGEMISILVHPVQNKMEWGMVTIWAFFMQLIFITIKKMGDSIHHHDYGKVDDH